MEKLIRESGSTKPEVVRDTHAGSGAGTVEMLYRGDAGKKSNEIT